MGDKVRSGGRILVDQLRIQGVETAFGVLGESYLEVLDALHDTPEIRFVICRQDTPHQSPIDTFSRASPSQAIGRALCSPRNVR